jgi:hypothetical protein
MPAAISEDEFVTRREFDKLESRVVQIDTNGTRGVVVVQERLIELAKEVARLDVQVKTKFEQHDRQHEQEKRDRLSARRWLISTGIAGIASFTGVYILLFDLLRHAH